MATLNCICLKYGTLYDATYVNRLGLALRRNSHSDLRFFCLTDDRSGIDAHCEILPLRDEPYTDRMEEALKHTPKRGRLKKISMFRPDLIPDLDGPLLVLDLDVAIVGDVDALRDYAPGKVCMRREWRGKKSKAPSLGHGSVEKIEPLKHAYLYEEMLRDPEAATNFGHGSEQSYTSLMAQKHGDLEFYPDEWIASFKYNCRPKRPLNLFVAPKKPAGSKVVCFHGNPKMPDAIAGYRANIFHYTKPCDWLNKAWSDN